MTLAPPRVEGGLGSGKTGFAAVGGGEGLLEAAHLGEDGVVVAEGAHDALHDGGAEEGSVAGGGEADGRGGDGEAGREAGERPALGLAVLDDADGEGGVHGGQGLAGGRDDHDLVDGGREGIAHPLEEGAGRAGSRRPCRSRSGGSGRPRR